MLFLQLFNNWEPILVSKLHFCYIFWLFFCTCTAMLVNRIIRFAINLIPFNLFRSSFKIIQVWWFPSCSAYNLTIFEFIVIFAIVTSFTLISNPTIFFKIKRNFLFAQKGFLLRNSTKNIFFLVFTHRFENSRILRSICLICYTWIRSQRLWSVVLRIIIHCNLTKMVLVI